jgi:HK97 family phage portal protein
MGRLTRLLSGESMLAADMSAGVADPWDDVWYERHGAMSIAGMPVSAEGAMRLSAVWAAVRILTEGIASLPCIVYQRLENDGKKRAPGHPLYELLRWQPNSWQTAMEFWEMMMGHVVLRGNAYAQIIPGKRGAVDQLIPRHPDRIRIETIETPDGPKLRYIWSPPKGQPITLTQDEVFHLRGLTSDGVVGLSVIEHATNSLGLSLAAERYGSKFFSQGATVAAVVEHPKTLTGEAAVKNLKWSIDEQVKNPHGVLVLEQGMTWKQIGMKAEEAQLIATMEFGIEEVARWFNVPLHLLRSNKQAQTYASIEMFDLELVIHTFRPWAVRFEQAIRRDLITGFETYFAEFLMDALMRGDSAARAAYYNSGIMTGWLTRNEARVKENLNPIDGLEEPLVPLNMAVHGQEPPEVVPSRQQNRASALAYSAAERVLRRELGAVQKAVKACAGDGAKYSTWAVTFYQEHAGYVAEAMAISPLVAGQYCASRQPGSYLRTEITDADRDALVAIALQDESRAA